MRIGLVSAEYPPSVGGVGDHTARLGEELAALGHDVEVLTSASPAAPKVATAPRALAVTVLREVRKWDWRILWQIPRIARERRWDVLHIQYQPAAYGLHGAVNVLPGVAGGVAAEVAQIAIRRTHLPGRGNVRPARVTTFHDLRYPYLFPEAGQLRTQAVWALTVLSDAVIAVSDDDLPTLSRWRAARPSSTTQHVPLGNQLEAALPDGFDRAAWRAQLGVAPDAAVVGYFGLINRSKGVAELFQAVSELPDVHLVMLGERLGGADPTNRAYLEEVLALVEHLGLAPRVHWTGHISPEQLRGWLEAVDVVALPFLDGASLRRTSLIAAWAAGAPVVTTDPEGDASWRCDPVGSDVARFVPRGDASVLVTALCSVLNSADVRAGLAESGKRLAARFAWPAVARQTVGVYEAALAARRA